MAEAAAVLVGTHDFSTFGVIHPRDPRSPLKRMRRLEVHHRLRRARVLAGRPLPRQLAVRAAPHRALTAVIVEEFAEKVVAHDLLDARIGFK